MQDCITLASPSAFFDHPECNSPDLTSSTQLPTYLQTEAVAFLPCQNIGSKDRGRKASGLVLAEWSGNNFACQPLSLSLGVYLCIYIYVHIKREILCLCVLTIYIYIYICFFLLIKLNLSLSSISPIVKHAVCGCFFLFGVGEGHRMIVQTSTRVLNQLWPQPLPPMHLSWVF